MSNDSTGDGCLDHLVNFLLSCESGANDLTVIGSEGCLAVGIGKLNIQLKKILLVVFNNHRPNFLIQLGPFCLVFFYKNPVSQLQNLTKLKTKFGAFRLGPCQILVEDSNQISWIQVFRAEDFMLALFLKN